MKKAMKIIAIVVCAWLVLSPLILHVEHNLKQTTTQPVQQQQRPSWGNTASGKCTLCEIAAERAKK